MNNDLKLKDRLIKEALKIKQSSLDEEVLDEVDDEGDDEFEENHERRKNDRRKQVDPTTCERDYRAEEVEFMRAMDDYKRRSGRQFPTWSEVLEVFHSLGYRKVAEPTDINHEKRESP
jgi:hypothetical protein